MFYLTDPQLYLCSRPALRQVWSLGQQQHHLGTVSSANSLPRPRPPESESAGRTPDDPGFKTLSGQLWFLLKVENCRFSWFCSFWGISILPARSASTAPPPTSHTANSTVIIISLPTYSFPWSPSRFRLSMSYRDISLLTEIWPRHCSQITPRSQPEPFTVLSVSGLRLRFSRQALFHPSGPRPTLLATIPQGLPRSFLLLRAQALSPRSPSDLPSRGPLWLHPTPWPDAAFPVTRGPSS